MNTPLPSPLAALLADAVRLAHLGVIVSNVGGLAPVPAGTQKAGAVRAAAGISPGFLSLFGRFPASDGHNTL